MKNRITIMCPICGYIKTPLEKYSVQNCDYCNKLMERVDFDGEIIFSTSQDERHLIEEKIYRKFLYNNSQYDEKMFDKRLKEYREMVEKMFEDIDGNRTTPLINTNTLSCPKCGSTAITTGNRGFSIWTGFFGSGATVNRCGNCGYRWKP